VATSDSDDDRPGPTPVPPRGGPRKPNRPPAKKAAATKKGPAGRSTASGKARPADNRRVERAKQRRRNQTLFAGGAIALVIIVVAVFVIIKVSGGGTKSNTAAPAVAPSTLTSFTSAVSLSAMKSAADNYPLGAGSYPSLISGAPTTKAAKPDLLYIGAEYCPYCATERWPLVLALSKFGTFSGLHSIHSSATDTFPNTATFSFYKSTYTSQYLTFTPVEEETVDKKPLQTPTAAEQTIADKYDTSGDIPFVYFDGKAQFDGAEYSAGLLAGKSFQQIADDIKAGTSPLASSVTADAGVLVSMICKMTGGKPGNVCSSFPKPITS
jgi:hypothetical protein